MKSFKTGIDTIILENRAALLTLLTALFFMVSAPAYAWERDDLPPEFDFTVLAELNQQAAKLGTLPAGFQENPSPAVKALALEVQGFLQSSHIHFPHVIRQEILDKHNVKIEVHPTLQSLFLTTMVQNFSELLDTLQRSDRFSFHLINRYRPEDLYTLFDATFPIVLLGGEEYHQARTQQQLAYLKHYYGEKVPRLQMLARSIAVAAFLMMKTPDCNATGSAAWNAQMLEYVRSSWLGASGATIFLESRKFHPSKETCTTARPYSERQLLKIAKKLIPVD